MSQHAITDRQALGEILTDEESAKNLSEITVLMQKDLGTIVWYFGSHPTYGLVHLVVSMGSTGILIKPFDSALKSK